MWSWLSSGGGSSSSGGIVDGTDASTLSLVGSSPLSSGAAPQSGAVFQLTERVLAFVYGTSFDGGNERERDKE